MHKIKYLFPLLFVMLISCSSGVTEDDLIGGTWYATAGYKDGKPDGEPTCVDIFAGGLKFKEDETVYGEEYDEEYEYILDDWDGRRRIVFIRNGKNRSNYFIDQISKDEIGLIGAGKIFENETCYLEREE